MLDSKGRLFGRVSLVDLFAAVVLFAVFFVVFNGIRKSESPDMSGEQPLIITFFSPIAHDFVAHAFREGASVTDSERNIPLGHVTGIGIGDSVFFSADRQGNEIASHREGYASVHVSTRVTGRMTGGAAVLGGTVYAVGMEVYIWAGDTWLITHISNITEAGHAY